MATEESMSPQSKPGNDLGDRVADTYTDAAVESSMDLNSMSTPLLHALPDPGNGSIDAEDGHKFVCPCEVDESLLKGWPPMPLIVQVCSFWRAWPND